MVTADCRLGGLYLRPELELLRGGAPLRYAAPAFRFAVGMADGRSHRVPSGDPLRLAGDGRSATAATAHPCPTGDAHLPSASNVTHQDAATRYGCHDFGLIRFRPSGLVRRRRSGPHHLDWYQSGWNQFDRILHGRHQGDPNLVHRQQSDRSLPEHHPSDRHQGDPNPSHRNPNVPHRNLMTHRRIGDVQKATHQRNVDPLLHCADPGGLRPRLVARLLRHLVGAGHRPRKMGENGGWAFAPL